METLNCRPPLSATYLRSENNVDDVAVQPEMKRSDIDFKRNLLTMKSEHFDDAEINGDLSGVDDYDEDDDNDEDGGDDDNNEDGGDDDSDEYGECYDGPYQFLSDDYDECDFTPQELQEFLYQQQEQQQNMYSLRRYSLLETIQEETYDELRMSSVSDESCRSDYSSVWCWGDDYPDDGTESLVTCLQPQVDPEPVFGSDVEENPLSDREGSWLDLDGHSHDQVAADNPSTVSDADNHPLENLLMTSDVFNSVKDQVETVRMVETAEMSSWSDAIDAYLMSRASTTVGDKTAMVGRKSCTGSRNLSGKDLSFASSAEGENDAVTVLSNESASSSVEDDLIWTRFFDSMSRNIHRLSGVKSASDLFQHDLSDSFDLPQMSRFADDDTSLKKVTNFSIFGYNDIIGWNDDINKSQSLPCINLERADQHHKKETDSQVTLSLNYSRMDVSSLNNLSDGLLCASEGDESEKEDDEDFSSEECGDHSALFCNRSQPLLQFLQFTRPASLRSFRSFDTSLHLAGMKGYSEDESDDMTDKDAEDAGLQNSTTNLRPVRKSCEDLSEDSGCCDVTLMTSKSTNSLLQKTPEIEEEECVGYSDILAIDSLKVNGAIDPSTDTTDFSAIEFALPLPALIESISVNNSDEEIVFKMNDADELPVSNRLKNVSEGLQMCLPDVNKSEINCDVMTNITQTSATVCEPLNGYDVLSNVGIKNDAQNSEDQNNYNLISVQQKSATPIENHVTASSQQHFGSNIIFEKAAELFEISSIESTKQFCTMESNAYVMPDYPLVNEVDNVNQSCDSVAGGWVLLCLCSDDKMSNFNNFKNKFCLQHSTNQFFEPSKNSAEKLKERSGNCYMHSDVKKVGATKNTFDVKNKSVYEHQLQSNSDCLNCEIVVDDDGKICQPLESCIIQRKLSPDHLVQRYDQHQAIEIISFSAVTNPNYVVVTASQHINDTNKGDDENIYRESVQHNELSVLHDRHDQMQLKIEENLVDNLVKSSSVLCAGVDVKLEQNPDILKLNLESQKVYNETLNKHQPMSEKLNKIETAEHFETSLKDAIENRKRNLLSSLQLFTGIKEKSDTKNKEKPTAFEKSSSLSDIMETVVDKEKDKKKKGNKKSWWFLPKSKHSEFKTVDMTLQCNENCSGKSPKKSSVAQNGYSVREAGLNNVKDPIDLTELETHLDMETFTNNLWIEFENEHANLWPNKNVNSQLPSATASNKVVEISTADNFGLANVNQHSCNSNELNQKVDKVERNENVELVKPPLPSSLPSAQGSQVQVGMPKICQKISVNKDNVEVSDPCLVFDKLRQIAKEGRERAAKSVQDLNELEENFRIRDNKSNSEMNDIDDEISWASTPFWRQFIENETDDVNCIDKCQTPTTSMFSNKHWRESIQSLVGYLETDIDTFHSREVIRVNPYNHDATSLYSTSRRDVNSGLTFGSNVKRHRPVKLKTQSLFNLIDSSDSHNNAKVNLIPLTPELDVDGDMTSTSSSRAKSMEFLLKAENKAAVEAPENRLMRLRTNVLRNSDENDLKMPEMEVANCRAISEHEERIRRSLQRLNLPEWYTNSQVSQLGSGEYQRRDSEERRSLRWEDYRNRSNSSSSIFSGAGLSKTHNTVVISKRVMAPDWCHVRSSRESLVPSLLSQASSTHLDKADDCSSHINSNFGLSRWSSSRLSTNSSRSSSPTSGSKTSSVYRSSIKHLPYLGWRSSEKLAALEKNSNTKPAETFYRSAAERLSKGPGYYALRFGVYSCHSSKDRDADLSLV